MTASEETTADNGRGPGTAVAGHERPQTVTAGALERALQALEDARARTLALVAHLDDDQIERQHAPIMSPLAWDLAHIAAYEDLWLAHRHAGLALLRADLASRYDAFETPRAVRGSIAALDAAEARAYMVQVRERVREALGRVGIGDGVLCEMVVRHELQHGETMLQTLALAGLRSDADRAASERPMPVPEERPGWVEVPAGPFDMGAPATGFAYDNERPRHAIDVAAFRIARYPVSAGNWMEFDAEGGYARRAWWSPAGWAWRQEHDAAVHPSIAAGDPRAPACHVSWYEAEAFARSRGARLPTEAEWEKAAIGDDQLRCVGRVWEWTQSAFGGYPGFVAHPYREYSEVFFGRDYSVLRGGSWATSPRVASPRFRNWDLPQRRQIFAGLRLAQDPS